VMRYLQDTKDLALKLEASGDGVIRWWVDASFSVQTNMRSHTGAVLSLGKGCLEASKGFHRLLLIEIYIYILF
jgi:hypothetical protein